MPESTASNVIVNVPNALSALRFLLAVVVFTLLPWQRYETTLAALVIFAIAVGTDWIDGYWARRFNQVTKLGRVLDPFVDKIIICGTYILLAAEQLAAGQWFGITSWMAVVVVGREILVTALRSAIEQSGGDFSAKWSGKWKMVFQSAAAAAGMLCLMHHQHETTAAESIPAWLFWAQVVSAYLAVITTVYSGIEYVIAASRMLRR